MIRLLGSVLGMVVLFALGGTLVADTRFVLGTTLCLIGFAAFVGSMTNPSVTALTAATATGIALIAAGRVMEGIGILILLAAVVLDRRLGRSEPT